MPKEKETPKPKQAQSKESRERKRLQDANEGRRDTRTAGSAAGSSHRGERLGDWTPAQMKRGWQMVQDPTNKKSKTAIAKEVDISRTTFCDRCKLLEEKLERGETLIERDFILQSGGKFKPRSLTWDQEEVLVHHVESFGKRGFPLRPLEVRTMAHEMLEEGDNNTITRKGEEMSWNWQKGFLERNPSLSKKMPKQMSMARATQGSDRDLVDAWFDKYAEMLEENEISDPINLWNIDETGVNECPKTGVFIVNDKSKAPFIIPKERGQNITSWHSAMQLERRHPLWLL